MAPKDRRWLVGAIVVSTAGFVALVAAGVVAPDEMTVILVLVVVAGVAVGAIRHPQWVREVARRLQSVKVGAVELGLIALVEEAGRELGGSSVDEGDDETIEGARSDLDEIQVLLETNLAYIATRLLPENESLLGSPGAGLPYATFGSLRADRYLSEAQAGLASRLLRLDESQLAALPAEERTALLRTGRALAKEIRLRVFSSLVRKLLRQEHVGTVRSARRSRRGLWVEGLDGRRVLVWPSLALASDSKRPDQARERAAREASDGTPIVVVVPNESTFGGITAADAPDPVVRLRDLTTAMAVDRRRGELR